MPEERVYPGIVIPGYQLFPYTRHEVIPPGPLPGTAARVERHNLGRCIFICPGRERYCVICLSFIKVSHEMAGIFLVTGKTSVPPIIP